MNDLNETHLYEEEKKEQASGQGLPRMRRRIPVAEKIGFDNRSKEEGNLQQPRYAREYGNYERTNNYRSYSNHHPRRQEGYYPSSSYMNGNESFAKNTPRNAEGTTENGGYKREYSNRGYGTNYYPSPRYPQARDHRSYYGRDSYTPKNDMAYEAGPVYQEGGESAPMGYPRQSYSSYRRPSMDRRFGHGPIKSKYTKPHKRKPLNPNPKEVIRYKDLNADPDQPLRLNKYLANAGICSRRDADAFIQAGMVKVNDVVVKELGAKVMRSDVVQFKNKTVVIEDKIYVLLNKPKNYVTTSDDPQNRKKVMDLVKNACPERIYPVGRLDRNTTGVLLLTNDGDLAAQLTHPKFLKKKIYHVFLDKEITEEQLDQIRNGIELEDGLIKADAIEFAKDEDKKQVGIEIHSGKNRIVRRIFEHMGFFVKKLDRVYFAGLTKKNLKRGQWRYLTPDEVNMLKMGAFE